MKAEKEVIPDNIVEAVTEETVAWPEPQTEFGRKILELVKEIDASGLPKLSLEEIEEYLGRKLGGIAEAFPDGIIVRAKDSQPSQD